jgi:hypothetical protein
VGIEAGGKDFGDLSGFLGDQTFPEIVNCLLRRVGDLAIAGSNRAHVCFFGLVSLADTRPSYPWTVYKRTDLRWKKILVTRDISHRRTPARVIRENVRIEAVAGRAIIICVQAVWGPNGPIKLARRRRRAAE